MDKFQCFIDNIPHDNVVMFYDNGFEFKECANCGKRSIQKVVSQQNVPTSNVMNEWLAGNPIESIKGSV